ncbi:hypothetical protein SSIG_07635 [Streptomyces filamentosus NRRL 11379]|nr:hypothetical protein SSIG_07635 [Streptomyces filamentosus NRRL 11379]
MPCSSFGFLDPFPGPYAGHDGVIWSVPPRSCVRFDRGMLIVRTGPDRNGD